MKEILELSLSDPTKLENLYRSDKSGFRKAFFELFKNKTKKIRKKISLEK